MMPDILRQKRMQIEKLAGHAAEGELHALFSYSRQQAEIHTGDGYDNNSNRTCDKDALEGTD